jgi:hypothetical protein
MICLFNNQRILMIGCFVRLVLRLAVGDSVAHSLQGPLLVLDTAS